MRLARTFLFSLSFSVRLHVASAQPLTGCWQPHHTASDSYGHIFEDGGRIVMQIGRPQISFYSILRMANLGSKAREKGQNYKDLRLLPSSFMSKKELLRIHKSMRNH